MSANMGTFDRASRFLAGAGLIVLAYFETFVVFSSPFVKFGAMAIGIILIGTALLRFCPAYRVFGIKTCKAS